MKQMRVPVLLLICAGLGLAGCTDPARLGDGTTARNTQQGALLGAASGAALGAIAGGSSNRAEGALVGAVFGAAIGAGAGYQLDKQEAELRAQLANEDVVITNTGDSLVVTLPQDILFPTDSFALRPDLQNDLQTVAGNLRAYPNSSVQIIGHTDSDGEASYNQTLSQQRAGAVSTVLLDGGVAPGRVQTVGRGEDQPVASNLTPEGKAQNRRVEIVILPSA